MWLWRFYDHFRTDRYSPARQLQIGTRTPILSHDGHDLASAIQTIREIGNVEALQHAVDDAFLAPALTLFHRWSFQSQHAPIRFAARIGPSGVL